MIAIVISAIYLLGLFFGLFILIPLLLADGTIARWDTEDAVFKAIFWPVYLVYLCFIGIVVAIVAVIYMPFDFMFERAVKYFADKQKQKIH